jgi:hypothetical protein
MMKWKSLSEIVGWSIKQRIWHALVQPSSKTLANYKQVQQIVVTTERCLDWFAERFLQRKPTGEPD